MGSLRSDVRDLDPRMGADPDLAEDWEQKLRDSGTENGKLEREKKELQEAALKAWWGGGWGGGVGWWRRGWVGGGGGGVGGWGLGGVKGVRGWG